MKAVKGWNVRSEGGRVGGFSGPAQRDVPLRDEDARQEVMKRRVKLQLMQGDRQRERGEEKKKVVRRKGEIKKSGTKVKKRGFQGSCSQPFTP